MVCARGDANSNLRGHSPCTNRKFTGRWRRGVRARPVHVCEQKVFLPGAVVVKAPLLFVRVVRVRPGGQEQLLKSLLLAGLRFFMLLGVVMLCCCLFERTLCVASRAYTTLFRVWPQS